jgi:uroporphyrinogen-III decarboxylase
MLGGFDKTVMHLGEDAIRREFERILPAIKSGGYIPSVDHQTPPDVDLETYKTYVRLLNEYGKF